MPAGQVTIFSPAQTKIGAEFDLATDEFTVILTTNAQALTGAFTGSSGQALYSDLTAEVSGSGYTAGGTPLVNHTWTRAGAIVTFNADSTTWAALTATAKYAVIARLDTSVSPAVPTDLVCFFDLETGDPAGRTSAGGDFILNWAGTIFTLTRVP